MNGSWTFEPLDLARHLDLLHAWVTHPRSRFWGMQGATREAVLAEYRRIEADPHHEAWLGSLDGQPILLAERYHPAFSELAAHYPVEPGDVGMHMLVAPPQGLPRHGLTSAAMGAVLAWLFADPATRRVVVEPDVRNEAIQAKNTEAGFTVARDITLATKTARLSFCTRAAYLAALPERTAMPGAEPPAHLTPHTIAVAHRHLVAKALAEFSHERLLAPQPLGGGEYRLETERSVYHFRARRHALDHWAVVPESVTREAGGQPVPLDALDLVAELAGPLGIPPKLIGTYLEEISATLAGYAWKLHHHKLSAADLVHAGFQQIEAAMTEGHPGFVANNGRIGFGLADHEAYAPESGRPVRLVWLAVLKAESTFTAGEGVDEETHYAQELGDDLARFRQRLADLGLDPAGYRFLPAHPWQWEHKHAITFAADVARRAIVPVGYGSDDYQAQQSIRTFFNLSHPERHYVKVALSIQNMGFMRGLSPAYMRATPPINDWVAQTVAADETLRECGFTVLRELASVGYTGDAYHRSGAPVSAYHRMLAALWRESPLPKLLPGERVATMASLLHRDRHGRALVSELVRASGLAARDWVSAYLHAYLRPLVHCVLRHDLAFMPHGENIILVLQRHVPTRVFLKDIGEEVAVMNDQPLPEAVQRIRIDVGDDIKELAILTDVVDGFLRHLAAILDGEEVLPEAEFWALATQCLTDHAAGHPALTGRLNLLRPTFSHSCLNRLQLRNTLHMVDLTDQAGSLIFAGELENPMARVPAASGAAA